MSSRIPTEILHHLIEYAEQSELATWCRMSRSTLQPARALLYHSIVLSPTLFYGLSVRPRRRHLLLSDSLTTFTNNPYLQPLVRKVTINWSENSRISDEVRNQQLESIAAHLRLLPSVQDLAIHCRCVLQWRAVFEWIDTLPHSSLFALRLLLSEKASTEDDETWNVTVRSEQEDRLWASIDRQDRLTRLHLIVPSLGIPRHCRPSLSLSSCTLDISHSIQGALGEIFATSNNSLKEMCIEQFPEDTPVQTLLPGFTGLKRVIILSGIDARYFQFACDCSIEIVTILYGTSRARLAPWHGDNLGRFDLPASVKTLELEGPSYDSVEWMGTAAERDAAWLGSINEVWISRGQYDKLPERSSWFWRAFEGICAKAGKRFTLRDRPL